MAAAMSPSLIMRKEAPARTNLRDDFLMTRPIEHHDDHILHTFLERARDERERFIDRILQLQSFCRDFCMYSTHIRPVGKFLM